MTTTTMIHVDGAAFFHENPNNWLYCKDKASFWSRDNTEFILNLYQSSPEYFATQVEDMEFYGCSFDFIAAVKEARALGAHRVLFYA